MTYRNIGLVLVLVACLLCLVQIKSPSFGLMVWTIITALLGISVVVGTAVEGER